MNKKNNYGLSNIEVSQGTLLDKAVQADNLLIYSREGQGEYLKKNEKSLVYRKDFETYGRELLNKSPDDLVGIMVELGEPVYRAKQLYAWILAGAVYDEMTNLPLSLRAKLAERFSDVAVKIVKSLQAKDGSEKYLYQLADSNIIEGVFLPNAYGNTLCVSSQAGCRMGCIFCASGENGLERNLESAEIVGQFIMACKRQINSKSSSYVTHYNDLSAIQAPSRAISNIVLMGSGEPLDNYDNVIRAIRMLIDTNGLNVSARNISLSTCGLVPRILKLAKEGLAITLSLSLHATTDEARRELMPIAKKYSIKDTINALKVYFEATGRRVCIEYVLVGGENDTLNDAKRLAQLVKDFSSHVNLITLNTTGVKTLKASDKDSTLNFYKELSKLGVSVSTRRSYGSDIFGACGQLVATCRHSKRKDD